jgi:hypothetical protein
MMAMRRVSWLAIAAAGCGRVGFDPDDGLVLHMKFEPGALLEDRARGHDATCQSCPSPTDGHAGGGAMFDGSACIHVADRLDLRLDRFTIAAWARTPTPTQATNIVARPRDGAVTADNVYELWVEVSDQWRAAVSGIPIDSEPLVAGVWRHGALAFDGATSMLYVDGLIESEAAVTLLGYESDELMIGCDIDYGAEDHQFEGAIDDVRIYERALDAVEMDALAAM